jgi:hypothetical protein
VNRRRRPPVTAIDAICPGALPPGATEKDAKKAVVQNRVIAFHTAENG